MFLALFLVASFLMIWRLEAMNADGFEGTVLGTLVIYTFDPCPAGSPAELLPSFCTA